MRACGKLAGLVGLLAGVLFGTGAWAQDSAAGQQKSKTCAACHGEDGNSASGLFPSLAGQSARYIYLELKDYKEGRRTDPVMSPQATPLSRDDMLDLAAYYAAQTLRPTNFVADGAKAELGAAKARETLCTMCHLGGFKGQNEIPRVAGQQHDYIVKQLTAFKARTRTNDAGNMTSVAQTLSPEDIENLAQYLASLN
ncbi:MAG: c-type cytochrome [Burkholderiaceae bacterium]|jgi:cytochrome c553